MPNSAPEHSPVASPLHLFVSGRFGWLLVSIVLLILFSGDSPDTTAGQGISILLFALILVGTTVAARAGKKLLALTIGLNLLFFGAWSVQYFHPQPATILLTLCSLMACLIVALLSTLRFVLRAGRVTADHIMGAMCSYALIAMIFANIYSMQCIKWPEAFRGISNHPATQWADLFYFSCTTLSTVGYGDIIPVMPRARSVVIIEQMTGTFYVALLIARLANLYTRPAPKNETGPTSDLPA